LPPKADAIVVLGCRLRPDGTPSRRLRRRVARAVELYRAEAAPLMLFSGGGDGPVAEAEVMRDLAVVAGVPDAALVCESDSNNTAENARHTARLLRQRGLSRVILVSDQTHLPRAALLFRLTGLEVVGRAGVPSRSLVRACAAAIYEFAALPRSLLRLWVRPR
jgi:uncharacterized SAM-binding protein YcdF (DUF218 family)